MVTYNLIQKLKYDSKGEEVSELKCDLCNSVNIKETNEGYVCGDCGIVLEVLKLQYHRPYNDDILQYAPLGQTQIGTKRERYCFPNSVQWENWNRLHSIRDNENIVLNTAKQTISKIFSNLHLPNSYQKIVFQRFKKVRSKLRPSTKYRSVEKLVPVIIYYTFKLRNVSINEVELINASGISKKEFKDFFLQLRCFIPEYAKRNRQEYIIQKMLQVTEYFDLGLGFYYLSKKIMYKLWELIKNTTDDVIVGVATSISALSSYKDGISVNAICKMLGVKMSSVQFQVRERIFRKLKVEGFISLVRSSDLLRKIMERLGLIEPEEVSAEESADIVEIIIGNASQVFNCHNGVDYYFFAVRDDQDNPILMTIRIYNPNIHKEPNQGFQAQEMKLFDYERLVYYRTKDPPLKIV
ncbi:MAG: hypothetical protein ACFFAQ_04015 [Promethearchaeota archaeon]